MPTAVATSQSISIKSRNGLLFHASVTSAAPGVLEIITLAQPGHLSAHRDYARKALGTSHVREVSVTWKNKQGVALALTGWKTADASFTRWLKPRIRRSKKAV